MCRALKYIFVALFFALYSCDEVFDEVRISGGTWELTKVTTVEYLPYTHSDGFYDKRESWEVDKGVLSYRLDSKGTFSLLSSDPALWGSTYEWEEGTWTYKDSILCLKIDNRVFTYRMESLFKDKLTLFYNDGYYDVYQYFKRNDK